MTLSGNLHHTLAAITSLSFPPPSPPSHSRRRHLPLASAVTSLSPAAVTSLSLPQSPPLTPAAVTSLSLPVVTSLSLPQSPPSHFHRRHLPLTPSLPPLLSPLTAAAESIAIVVDFHRANVHRRSRTAASPLPHIKIATKPTKPRKPRLGLVAVLVVRGLVVV
ncbi:hypothetical protein Scep_012198 [Stephania cephalantha]|uniref:Uncharacterized protein n=1 Tax=Stephania cephalantha TaxID=152367 RepID=A0AAP0P9A5_9MAGN